jgi:putative aldouronate transport system substrate-binding protein
MYTKKSYRILTLGIVLVLLLGLFSACGQQTTPGKTNDPKPTTAPSTGTSGSAAPSKLRVEIFDRATQGGSDPTNNYWTDWIKEKMLAKHNIEVSFESVPRSEEIAQLNVLMAGNDAPDIVFTYTLSVVYNYFKQGGIADLTDLVDQYGPTIKSYLGEDVLSYGRFEGRQYIIPAKRISRAMYTTYMRKDWLDKLNLPVPTNHDEFFNALVAFKEQNPGNVEQVVPYGSASDVPWHFGTIVDSFIDLANMTDEQKFVLGVDASSSASTMLYPGFKEGIRYLNKMYNAGLIDTQFPLYKDFAPVDDLISRGAVGAFTANYDWPIRTTPGDYNNLKANVPGAELIPVDCFPNSEGKNFKQLYLPTGIYNFVPASSKNVEGAVKYFDFLCEEEVRTYLTTGEEGVNHTKDENGIPVMINLMNDPRMMNSPNNLDYAVVVNGVDLGDPSKNVLVLSKSYEAGYEDIFVKAYDIAMKDAFVINNKIIPFESEAQYTTTLNDKRKEILANAITASEADFDKVYDAGIQEWLNMGGQQCVDERQAYWDQYFK